MASSGEKWAEILQKYRVKDLLEEDGFVLKQVETTATIPEVLQILTENKIQSVPVFNPATNDYVGLIDMLDIATVTVLIGATKPFVDLAASHTVPLKDFFEQAQFVFRIQEVGELCNASARNEWRPIQIDSPIQETFSLLGHPCHLHRIPVVDADRFMRGFLTQSDIISWLNSLLLLLRATVLDIKIDSLPLGSSEVTSVTESTTAFSAYETMLRSKLSALAVVDSNGKLVGCLSASDLKRSPPHSLWANLSKPVSEYLQLSVPGLPSGGAATIEADATIGNLLKRLHESRYHRIFITDESGAPAKVISLTDVLSWFAASDLH